MTVQNGNEMTPNALDGNESQDAHELTPLEDQEDEEGDYTI